MRHPKFSRHAAALGLALLFSPSLASPARGQHTADPYNIVGEYNAGYEDSMYANYPNGLGFSPNQGYLQGQAGQRKANQFQNFVQELDGVGSDALFNRSRGLEPYYRAHRQYDDVFRQEYKPLLPQNDGFEKMQQARTNKYLEYLRTSDPKKRAELYREYTQMSLRSARASSAAGSRAALRPGTTGRAPASPAAGTQAPAGSTTREDPSRRPSTAPYPTSRTRGAAASPGTGSSETPSQIMGRAELMPRVSRPAAVSSSPSRAPATPSTAAPTTAPR